MSFLTPWVAAAVAAIVVPALILLYFLKLRRKTQTISSTFLWRRAVQDLQVNAPFQRLRRNLLLLLQLLVLAAGVFALARPIIESSISNEKSVILLIDRSASMNTREGERSRLDLAKEQAVRLVRGLNQTGSSWFNFGGVQNATRVMVISFADRAQIVSPFTTSTSTLPDLIQAIEPTDCRTNLREALELAEAHLQITRGDQRPNQEEAASRIVLLSDGGVADLRDLVARRGAVELIPIGEAVDNVAITGLRLQRNYERPEELSVFVQLANFGPEPVTTDVALRVGDNTDNLRIAAAREVQLDAAAPLPDPNGPAPDVEDRRATVGLQFDLTLNEAAVLEVRLSREDALPADNRAFAIVPPPRRLSVLCVSARNIFFESVLSGLMLASVHYWTPEQYESAPESDLLEAGRAKFDVVIFDKHDTARLPPGNYLFFRSLPQLEGVRKTGELEQHAAMWWDAGHPILRYVPLEYVVAVRGTTIELPPTARNLVEGPSGPMMALYWRDGRHFLLVTFAIEHTSWWQKDSFPIFMQNAMQYVGSGATAADEIAIQTGEMLRIALPPGTTQARLNRPAGPPATIHGDDQGVARFAGALRAGVYRLDPPAPGRDHFAVNIASADESDVRPRTRIRLGDAAVEVAAHVRTATPEIWRWFVGAALVLVLIEWYIYNRRVMI